VYIFQGNMIYSKKNLTNPFEKFLKLSNDCGRAWRGLAKVKINATFALHFKTGKEKFNVRNS
jgi:hypothetical protein